MKKMETEEIKKIAINILEYFDSICAEYNLNYSLYAGTLIGAARHQGFIPWDDDIDVAMPWDDYLKFCSILKNKQDSKYELHYNETAKVWDEQYHYTFAKLVDPNTEGFFYETRDRNGVFMDIFPITGVPDDEKRRDNHFKKMIMYHKLLSAANTKNNQGTILKRVYRGFANKIANICVNASLVELKRQNNENSKYVGQNAWANEKEIKLCPRDWFSEYTELTFESKKFKVFKEYDKILTTYYGDWRSLPPVEQRVPHHGYEMYKL